MALVVKKSKAKKHFLII